jgi:hypothetical protein
VTKSVGLRASAGAALAIATLAACTPPASTGAPPVSGIDPAQPPVRPDSGELIPPGRGSRRIDDIAIRLELGTVTVQLLPTSETVIRVLSPDSYESIRTLAASRGAEIERLARVYQLRERQLWLGTFHGQAPGARFTPTDLTITQAGRDFHPVEVVGLTTRFGEGRLQVGETQRGLYLLPDGLSLTQPMTVSMGSVRSSAWEGILRVIDREKALIRGRLRP